MKEPLPEHPKPGWQNPGVPAALAALRTASSPSTSLELRTRPQTHSSEPRFTWLWERTQRYQAVVSVQPESVTPAPPKPAHIVKVQGQPPPPLNSAAGSWGRSLFTRLINWTFPFSSTPSSNSKKKKIPSEEGVHSLGSFLSVNLR